MAKREQLPMGIGQLTIDFGDDFSSNDYSSCRSAAYAWAVEPSGALNYNNNNKDSAQYLVRPCASVPASPEAVYDIPFFTIIDAWIECEKRKRTTDSCTRFRWHVARDLAALWESICNGTYKPHASMCFMVTRPVLREVWAGAFRDRVVHHWEAMRFLPLIEDFIVKTGNRSYNCRRGYGSIKAVREFADMLKDYTDNYTRQDCWIVGGDFANFFMSIDKELLWSKLLELIETRYQEGDKDALLYLMYTTLMHRCTDNYYRKSPESMWERLPQRKSLFYMNGLPIGNLPSQLWANFMGAFFMRHMMEDCQAAAFMLFVDDFRFLVRSVDEGRELLAHIRRWLPENLHINLHPDKIYLQHYTKGVKFVGAVVKPGRAYVSNRTCGRFIAKLLYFRRELLSVVEAGRKDDLAVFEILAHIRASVNSYLGLMGKYKSYKRRRKILERYFLPYWGRWFYAVNEFRVVKLRVAYDLPRHLPRLLKRADYARAFIKPKW